MGGVKADVPEPGSNHVHIDTSFQQVNGGRMSKEMGVETTQIYLEATLAMKEQALAKTTPHHGRAARYHPNDRLLGFLNGL